MMVLESNREINRVEDLKGKIIGAQSYTHFSGAQAQFYVMERNGLDYIVDPKQVIFTGRSYYCSPSPFIVIF
jgi:ABC-type phosphate/phosphonate transport system substrate-binding protein